MHHLWFISGLRWLCAPLVVHIRVKVAVCLLWFISGLRWLCAPLVVHIRVKVTVCTTCGPYQG